MNGLVSVQSAAGFAATLGRLKEVLAEKHLTVFAEIDHAAGAVAAGLALRPTTLLIFGNPKGGTPLMQQAQAAGIDLPLKLLVWQDAEGAVRLTYNDPAWIAERHGLGPGPVTTALATALAAIAAAAAGR